MTRATEKAKKTIDVEALIKDMKDNARKESPKMQDLPRAKGGQSTVATIPKIKINK